MVPDLSVESFVKSVFGDLVQPFQIKTFGLRGRLERLGGVLDAAIDNHDYPLPVTALLYRLFYHEGVGVFRQRRQRHACRCSRERVATTLRAFPRAEVNAMADDGRIAVTCEFCKAPYVFDGNDVALLYAP